MSTLQTRLWPRRTVATPPAAPAATVSLAQPTLTVWELMGLVKDLTSWSRMPGVHATLPAHCLPTLEVRWGVLPRLAGTASASKPGWAPPPPPLPVADELCARKVTILIVTWNALDFTQRCLDTLCRNTDDPNYEILIVDNGSRDGTVEFLRGLPYVRLLENERNLGFVGGNNRGLLAADPLSDVVLLNNDIEIHQPDWLRRLRSAAHADADVGVVGCRLRRPGGVLQQAGTFMPLDSFHGQQIGGMEMDVNQYPENRTVEGIVFACAYLRRETLNRIGFLDDDYFSYFEDSDYCLKARRQGLRTVCCGSVTLEHHESVSTKVNKVSLGSMFHQSQAIFRGKWEEELRAGNHSRHIDWRSILNLPTGYGLSSRNLVLALERQGVEVAYRYLYGPGTPYPLMEPEHSDQYLLNTVRTRPFDPDGVQVVYGQGDAFFRNDGGYRVGYTMLETDGFPKEWVRQANHLHEVWVPSTFNVQTLRDSGLRRPVHVVPLGIDPDYFHPAIARMPNSAAFTFLSIFEWGERKAPEVLLRAFADEFRANESVVLLCKTVNRDEGVDVRAEIRKLRLPAQGGRIILSLNDLVPSYQLGCLYRSADCFVLPSRGEGWGLPALEAMACGLPVIATNWSSMTDFLEDDISYPLDVERLVPAQARCPYYEGFRWAEPSYEHLRALLRHVYEHPQEAAQRGALAARRVRERWTWKHSADRIIERLAEIEG